MAPPGHGKPDTSGRSWAARLPSWMQPRITRYPDDARGAWDMNRQRLPPEGLTTNVAREHVISSKLSTQATGSRSGTKSQDWASRPRARGRRLATRTGAWQTDAVMLCRELPFSPVAWVLSSGHGVVSLGCAGRSQRRRPCAATRPAGSVPARSGSRRLGRESGHGLDRPG